MERYDGVRPEDFKVGLKIGHSLGISGPKKPGRPGALRPITYFIVHRYQGIAGLSRSDVPRCGPA